MAKSIVREWPYLKEQLGKGYEGWLESIIEGLKHARKSLSLSKPAKRKAAVIDGEPEDPRTATSMIRRCHKAKPTSLNFSEKPSEGEDELSMLRLCHDMRLEMRKASEEKDETILLDWLRRTYPLRRNAINYYF